MTNFAQMPSGEPSIEQQIENTLNNLDGAITTLVAAVENFPVERREDILFKDWSLKDILAHFSGWNLITINDLELLRDGHGDQIAPWFPDEEIDSFNARSVSERETMIWRDVYAEFIRTLNELYLAYRNLTVEQWESLLGSNPARPLDSIEVDIIHIGETHLGDIQRMSEE